MTIPAREGRVEEHVEHAAAGRGRVVVADDDVLVREGVISLLERSGFEVVGQAGDAEQLLDLVGEHLPDLAIIDIRMPPTYRAEGLAAAHHIRKEFSSIGIVLLSAYVAVNDAMDLLASCERVGYLLKSRVTDVNDFIDSLERIMKGGSVVDPSLIMELLNARRERQIQLDDGALPDFLPHTAAVRAADWRIAPVPQDLIDRRVAQMEAEGVIFRTNMEVGKAVSVQRLLDDYEVLVLAGGAELPRDLDIPGRELDGVHFAMDFLTQQNKRVAGDAEEKAAPNGAISAKGKHVVVIGGGDTGSDCIGTSNRHGAASVTQLEILPQPPVRENKALTWPDWPLKLRTSSSHEEGAGREFSVLTKRFVGSNGKVEAIECRHVEWVSENGRMAMREVAGSEFTLKADLVLFAMGFLGPRVPGLVEQSGVDLDPRGNVQANTSDYRTSNPRIFACGDMRRGQSLVVWAIREGRQCAESVDAWLMAEARAPA